jgi:hypothetical protein
MFANIQAEHIAVMIPIVFLLGAALVISVAIVVAGRKKDLEHKERLVALEKGLPLPEPAEREMRPVHALRRAWGLVWAGIGLALTIALATNPAAARESAWAWGLIPLFIGAGLLIAAILDKKEFEERLKRSDGGHSDSSGPPASYV